METYRGTRNVAATRNILEPALKGNRVRQVQAIFCETQEALHGCTTRETVRQSKPDADYGVRL